MKTRVVTVHQAHLLSMHHKNFVLLVKYSVADISGFDGQFELLNVNERLIGPVNQLCDLHAEFISADLLLS